MMHSLPNRVDRTLPKAQVWLLVALIVVASVLKLINVFNGPVHWDTNLYLNIAHNYFERGLLTPYMWRYNPEWNIITGAGSGYGIFFVLAWLRVFGVSVLAGHLFMVLVGLLTLPIVYLLGKRWYGTSAAGLWAVAFFAVSNTYAATYYVRMDALSILTSASLLLLFLIIRERNNLLLWVLLGVLSVAALEIHLLTIYCGISFGLYTLWSYVREARTTKKLINLRSPFVAFTVAGLIAGAVYILIHVAPNPRVYFEIPRLIMTDPTPRLWKELLRWTLYIGEQPWPLMLLFGLGLLAALLRRLPPDKLYILFAGCALLTFILLGPPYQVVYTGQLLPLFALGAAGLLSQGLDRGYRGLRAVRVFGLIVFALALVVRVSGTSFTYGREYAGIPYIDVANGMTPETYRAAVDYIRAQVDPQTVVMGAAQYYVDLFAYRNYISFNDGELHGAGLRRETMFDFWMREQPRVFIGAARANAQLIAYMQARGGFTEVIPFVWIENELLAK